MVNKDVHNFPGEWEGVSIAHKKIARYYNDVVFDLPAHLMHALRRSGLSWWLGGLAVVKSCSLLHTPGGAGLGHLGLAVDSSTPVTYSRCTSYLGLTMTL